MGGLRDDQLVESARDGLARGRGNPPAPLSLGLVPSRGQRRDNVAHHETQVARLAVVGQVFSEIGQRVGPTPFPSVRVQVGPGIVGRQGHNAASARPTRSTLARPLRPSSALGPAGIRAVYLALGGLPEGGRAHAVLAKRSALQASRRLLRRSRTDSPAVNGATGARGEGRPAGGSVLV